MKFLYILPLLISLLAVPADAMEFTAPVVPDSGLEYMPESNSFADGLRQLVQTVFSQLRPDLVEASRVSMALIGICVLTGLIAALAGKMNSINDLTGAAAIGTSLLLSTNSLIRLAGDTVLEITEYGKLLLPVMTGAMAAQGQPTASAALYAGTAAFASFLGKLISSVFLPGVYLYLALSISYAALGEESMKRLRDTLKNSVSWFLKTLLTVFVTYMSITGVISGTTDAAALKAAKVSISTFVPVVGGILSDASEAVLVSAGIAKNAAGVYGILAMLAVFLHPFLQIGIHYLLLKLTSVIASLVGTKRHADLILDFSGAMGLLLGMTGSVCLLQLVSTVCFMKGVG